MPNAKNLSTEEKQLLLSTFDGCTVDLKLNSKQLFDTDSLVLFAKTDALYVEMSDHNSKESSSTRLVILYENIDDLNLHDQNLVLETVNHTVFDFTLKRTA